MESIQLAQMLADLSDLNAAQETQAAVSLVNANKLNTATAPAPTTEVSSSKTPETAPVRPDQRHQRIGSASSIISRAASPAKFDKFGRRILTPPMSRTNSAQGSIPGTPRRDTELEDDVDRASTLMHLYELRAKMREQDNTSLLKLREKIAALQARQHAEKKDSGADTRLSRYTYPKAPV